MLSEPFAVAYGVGALGDAMVVDIGAGTVDFCIMHGAVPEEDDEKSLLTACDYIDQQLCELLAERFPQTDFNLHMARQFKEQFGFVGQSQERVIVSAPVQGKQVEHDITVQLRQACESIMAPIAETIMSMIARFDPEFQDKVRRNIILAGGGSQIRGIAQYLTQATRDFAPCSFSCVDAPLFAGAAGALELARDMPAQYWDDL